MLFWWVGVVWRGGWGVGATVVSEDIRCSNAEKKVDEGVREASTVDEKRRVCAGQVVVLYVESETVPFAIVFVGWAASLRATAEKPPFAARGGESLACQLLFQGYLVSGGLEFDGRCELVLGTGRYLRWCVSMV